MPQISVSHTAWKSALVVLPYWLVLLLTSVRPGVPTFVMPSLLMLGLPVLLYAGFCLWRSATLPSTLAFRDEMTGIGNRRAFMIDARAAFEGAKAGSRALVLIDVDGLKALNDACGHPAGDELLVAVGSLLSSSKVGAYRIGGDEFALIVDRKQGATVSASLQRLQPFELEFASCGHRHRVGLTYGYASLHENESFDQVFRRADARLVQCKRRLYAGGHREDRRTRESGPGRTTPVDAAAREVLSLEEHRRSRTQVS